MNRLLREGDRFRFASPRRLAGALVFKPTPHADFGNLSTDGAGVHTAVWTEHGEDGWRRPREAPVDLTAPSELAAAEWRVERTATQGGGTAHGPRDVFPDGHHVVARRVGGTESLRFYQTGCFIGMVPPEDVELLTGPHDAACDDAVET